MYTKTNSLEQILHNNIIVSQALNALGLNLDVLVNSGPWQQFPKASCDDGGGENGLLCCVDEMS